MQGVLLGSGNTAVKETKTLLSGSLYSRERGNTKENKNNYNIANGVKCSIEQRVPGQTGGNAT